MTKKPLQDNRPAFDMNALSFVPLGGCGEFGCNMSVYHCNGKFLVVDCGLGFPDENQLGLEIMLPDPSFLEFVAQDIVGLVITHAHEDHIGAVAALWPRLNCPVYATPFTADLLRGKLGEWDLAKRVPLHVVPLSGKFDLAPFAIELINAAHSVPETSMLLIKTPHGNVLHTADWRLDDTPPEGQKTDVERLKKLADENILAVVGDSTNANAEKINKSEAVIEEALVKLIGHARGRVIVTSFSSHVGRIHNVASAAQKSGRKVAMAGRSILRIVDAAHKNGYLKNLPAFLSDKEIAKLPREQVVIFATGSQAQPGSALDRLSQDDHPTLDIEKGDLVVFSSWAIPGNEKAVERLKSSLMRKGVQIVTADQEFVHVSGHCTAPEIRQLYEWVKPHSVVPVHGEEQHMIAHAELAEETGVKHSIIPRNGDIIVLRESGPERTGHVASGVLAVDGSRVVNIKDSLLLKERSRISEEGSIVATVVIDEEGYLLHDPIFSIAGLGADEDDAYDLEDILMAEVEKAVEKAKPAERKNSEALREVIRLSIRRSIKQETGKRPLLDVHLIQLA